MSDNESWADTHWLWHYKDHTVVVRLRDVAGQENADGNEYALMMEAANEITRLKERVEELKRENEWISVEDRLPDTLGEHLVLVAPLAGCGFYAAAWYHDGLWEVRGENGNARDLITHWKPIKPPTEEG